MTTTMLPIFDGTQLLTASETAVLRERDAEPTNEAALAEAEEEEMAELWASDRGNQGA